MNFSIDRKSFQRYPRESLLEVPEVKNREGHMNVLDAVGYIPAGAIGSAREDVSCIPCYRKDGTSFYVPRGTTGIVEGHAGLGKLWVSFEGPCNRTVTVGFPASLFRTY